MANEKHAVPSQGNNASTSKPTLYTEIITYLTSVIDFRSQKPLQDQHLLNEYSNALERYVLPLFPPWPPSFPDRRHEVIHECQILDNAAANVEKDFFHYRWYMTWMCIEVARQMLVELKTVGGRGEDDEVEVAREVVQGFLTKYE